MSEKFPQRFAWALEVLNVQPDDHLLEIGCGTGLLAIQIAHLMEKGKITALDKSEAQIKKAVTQSDDRAKETGICCCRFCKK